MRVIVGKERPHPGAQLRFTDLDGHRFTCFATDARRGQLPDLELRHRRRARCEDRIRSAKDTGLRNLPLQGYAQNQIWCEIVALACELLAWMQIIGLTGPARRWEPKRLRLRLFSAAGRIARGSRRTRLRLAARWPWATQIAAAVARLQASHPADQPQPSPRPGKDTRARGTPPTRRDSRAPSHRRALKRCQSRRWPGTWGSTRAPWATGSTLTSAATARVLDDLRLGSRRGRCRVYGVLHGRVLPVWRGMGSRLRRALSRLGGAAVVAGLGRSGVRACESRRAACASS
jgi:Transposase DDE domain group 1